MPLTTDIVLAEAAALKVVVRAGEPDSIQKRRMAIKISAVNLYHEGRLGDIPMDSPYWLWTNQYRVMT